MADELGESMGMTPDIEIEAAGTTMALGQQWMIDNECHAGEGPL